MVPLFAVIIIVAVGFVLVELHAPLSSPTTPSAPPVAAPPTIPVAGPPVAAPAPRPAAPPLAAPPTAPAADPLDAVVRGKTRREWHTYYAERQQKMTADIQRYQAIVDRAIAGEEPDPHDLANAHDQIRELNQRMKEDLEALQAIDATP
jgi:hypothetical protein